MKILIVKPSSLGDVIHAIPFLAAIKELYPDSEIHWVVNPVYQDLLRFNPYIDKLLLFDRYIWKKSYIAGYKSFYGLVKEMQTAKYDLAIDLQGLMRSALITFYSGAKEKVVINNTREGASLFYRKFIGSSVKDIHAVDRIMSAAIDLGWKERSLTWHDFMINVPEEVTAKIKETLGSKCEKLIVINPFTRWESKTWPVDNYALLIKELLAKGYNVALTGTSSDKPQGDIIGKLVDDARLMDFVGETTLIELVSLLKFSSVMISADSGPVHLANALGKKTITLFGPTSPERTGAYLTGNTILSAKAECAPCFKKICPLTANNNFCMKDISVETVLDQLT